MNFFHKKSHPHILICGLLLVTILLLNTSAVVYSKSASFDSTDIVVSASKNSVSVDSQHNANNIKLNTRSLKIIKGESEQLKILNLPSNYTVTYGTSNKKIASVTKNGVIKGHKNGEVTITAVIKYNNRTIRRLTCNVEIGPAAVSIVIPKSKVTLTVGKTHYINYITKPSNSVEIPVFKSSNKKVATVSKNGVIKAVAPGEVTITATILNGKSDTITVKVKKASS